MVFAHYIRLSLPSFDSYIHREEDFLESRFPKGLCPFSDIATHELADQALRLTSETCQLSQN